MTCQGYNVDLVAMRESKAKSHGSRIDTEQLVDFVQGNRKAALEEGADVSASPLPTKVKQILGTSRYEKRNASKAVVKG